MTDSNHLPVRISSSDVVAHAGQGHSLIARGMEAVLRTNDPVLAADHESIYRRARETHDHLIELGDKTGFNAVWTQKNLDDLQETLDAFHELADHEYGKAYFPLSLFYSGGRSFPAHAEKARYYAKLALEWCTAHQDMEDPETWNDLGRLYWLGEVIETDYAQAFYWYQKAAEKGLAQARYNLAALYQNGQGVVQDYQQAVSWYIQAAEQGHTRAQYALGTLYYCGNGVPQDYKQAAFWYRMGTEQGNAWAQLSLGYMFEHGQNSS